MNVNTDNTSKAQLLCLSFARFYAVFFINIVSFTAHSILTVTSYTHFADEEIEV